MDVEYKGQHAIVFLQDTGRGYIKRNSWIDFHMIPAQRPYVALGTPNYVSIPIPGTSKRIDVTDYKPGGITYGSRTGTWEFYIDHNKWRQWDTAYNTIKYYIHGNSFLVNLTDDPYILYNGILTVSGYVAGENYSKITIQYDLASETFTLDEPIDFGDFGKLPEPKLIDKDGDGVIDSIDTTGDGEPDVDLTESIGYDTDCDGKPDVFVAKDPLKRPQRQWVTKDGIVEGLDINGDGETDYWAITDNRNVYGLDTDCDGVVDVEMTRPPEDVVPEGEETIGYDTDCDGKPDVFVAKDPLKRPQRQWVTKDGIVEGLDINGDGETDYWAITDNRNVYGLDTDCDGVVDVEIDGAEPLPDPEDVPIEETESTPGEEMIGYDLDCDGILETFLPEDPNKRPKIKYIYEDGYPIGLDITGDNQPDYWSIIDSKGTYGIDTDCDGIVNVPLPREPLPDPEDVPIEGQNVYGYDTDCDGVVDIPIDQSNPINPTNIYDPDTEHLIGVDCDGDGDVDIYATTDEQGREGIDYDCDGDWDTEPYTPPDKQYGETDDPVPEPGQEDPGGDGGGETPVAIGAYYPLLFITNSGESSMYGFANVSNSGSVLGVYDLYTIYESDEVKPESSDDLIWI